MSRVQNCVTLLGNISSDIETKTFGESTLTTFTVAVNRPKTKDGHETTDFIRCSAWGSNAEFIAKYFSKGRKIALQGELQVETREGKDGTKRTYTSVRVDNVAFADSKSGGESVSNSSSKKSSGNAKRAVSSDEKMPWEE